MWSCAAVLAVCCAGATRAAAGQDSKSAPLARELSTLMTSRQLDVFAVEDPARPGFFIAVRSYPGVQLLLVGAASNSIEYMKYQLDRKDYGEAYAALHVSAVPATKLFVQDMGCDGVRREGDPVDVVYHQAATQILLDGTGKASGLSKSAYAAKATELDVRYADLLRVVLETIRAAAAGEEPGRDPVRHIPRGAAPILDSSGSAPR
jgi:hypothetical protein